ncbi:MAG: universal stress protein [Actinomycetota bacterium]|nr:universal stress protein [Actinomycetota bacterium]MDZ4177997.1 universal stress protein [Coriobacteriia bacterium]
MRVVIATDLSEASLAAVDLMTSCSPVAFEQVALVHAIDLNLYTGGGTVPAVIELAEERLGEIAADLRAAGFETTVHAVVGPAVEVIERIAAEEGAGLIVTTNLGHGAVVGRLFGSTAERLTTESRLPVLVTRVGQRDGAWCRLDDSAPFARVLVVADDGDSAAQLALVASLPGVGEVRVVAYGDDPGDELRDEVDAWNATAIVVSPPAYGALKRALLGSTADRVAKSAEVPVIFVPRERA